MQPQASFTPPKKSHLAVEFDVVFGVLLVIVSIFAVWAFSGRQDFKNNTDAKIAAAVAAAKTSEDNTLQAKFAEQLKQPAKTYAGSATFGSITFNYPLTYSVYNDTTNSSQPIEAYFYPGMVPGIQSGTAFALRVELVSTAYKDVLSQYTSASQAGKLTAAAFIPTKMKGVNNVQSGTLFTGQVGQDQQGNAENGASLVIPVRDKTLIIYTQSNDFISDFNNIVLPSLTFIP